MKRIKLTCPSCSARFAVKAFTGTAVVACPQCGKRHKLRRQASGSSGSSGAAPPQAAQVPAAVPEDEGESFADDDLYDDGGDEGEDYAAWDGVHGEADDAFGDYDDYGAEYGDPDSPEGFDPDDDPSQWATETPSASGLPPARRKKKARTGRKKTGAGKTPDASVLEAASSRRSLDDLTEGTYSKKQHFSEGGSTHIRKLLFTIGALFVMVLVAGYIRSQFRQAGLAEPSEDGALPDSRFGLLLSAYDYYAGNTEQPENPGAGPSLEEVVEVFVKNAPVAAIQRRQASQPRSVWTIGDPAQEPQWDLDADPGPSMKAIADLSGKVQLRPVGTAGTKVLVYAPDASKPLLVDVASATAVQLDGRPQPIPVTTEEGQVTAALVAYSPDVVLMARRTTLTRQVDDLSDPNRPRTRLVSEPFLSIHEYDNSLLHVIPGGRNAAFISNHAAIVERSAEHPDGDPPPGPNAGFLERELLYFDSESDMAAEPIRVPRGGHWCLTPGLRYLMVVHPDAETSEQLTSAVEPFNYQCRSVHVKIYDTQNFKPAGEGIFPDQTVGRVAVVSYSGKRLALCGGDRVCILDLENGTVTASGKTAHGPITGTIRWFGGDDMLQIGKALLSVQDGNQIGSPEQPIRLPLECLADTYVRDSRDQQYEELSADFADSAFEQVPAAAGDLLSRAVITVSGANSPVTEACVKHIVAQRLGLESADPEDGDPAPGTLTVEVEYSEHQVGRYPVDPWLDPDPLKRRVQKKRYGLPEEVPGVGVKLRIRCLAADRTLLQNSEYMAAEKPITLEPGLPPDMQFRVASTAAALRQFTLPALSGDNESPDTDFRENVIWTGGTRAESEEYPDVSVTVLQTDNSWVESDHGLPVFDE